MPNVTIKLATPIEGHEGQIKEIVLREPKFGDVIRLGEPSAYAQSEGGMYYTAEKPEVVEAYINRLLVQPNDPALLHQLNLKDSLQLKGAIFGFFQDARREN